MQQYGHSRTVAICFSPGVALGGIGRPHHGHSAGHLIQRACNHLVGLHKLFGLLPPDIPVAVHLVAEVDQETCATLQMCSRTMVSAIGNGKAGQVQSCRALDAAERLQCVQS